MNTETLQLTTLTPVCIGTGIKLSPYSDYVLRDNKIHYLNHEAIKAKLAQNPALIDEYVEGITRGKNNTSNLFSLAVFLENRLHLSLDEATLYTIPASAGGKKEMYSVIKNAGKQPYIPGSSLKGAIKTAFLYDWLIDNTNHWCKEYLQNLNNKYELSILEKKLMKEFDTFELGISDSSMLPTTSIKGIDIKRLSVKSGELTIPQTWEAITENNSCTAEIRNVRKKVGEEEYLDYTWKDICEMVNIYSSHSNDREWEIMELLGDKIGNNMFNDLFDFYEIMDKKTKEEHKAYLPIGSGKGYFFNSVGMALYDADESEDKHLFLSFLKKNGFGKVFKKDKRKWEEYDLKSDEFPLTRYIELAETKPLGWIKLTPINQE